MPGTPGHHREALAHRRMQVQVIAMAALAQGCRQIKKVLLAAVKGAEFKKMRGRHISGGLHE